MNKKKYEFDVETLQNGQPRPYADSIYDYAREVCLVEDRRCGMNLIDKKELLNERPEMLNPNMNDEIESAYNKGWNACNSEWIGLIDDDPSEIRLIDKNKLLKFLRKYHPISYGIFSDIEYFPTAYDVGKVIEQLEELEKDHPYKVIGQPDTYSQYNEAWQDCMDRVIGIVKRGGVEE